MPELHLKSSTSRPPEGSVIATNPLQESFIKLDQAEQLRQQGKLDRAQAICEALVRSYPDYFGALHTLGLVCADKGNYERAFDCLARAAMLNPRSWTTLTALSGVYLRLGAHEMAALMLEQARAIKPNDANVLVTLGQIYRDDREYELARDAFRQAVAVEPNLVPAIYGLGWVCSYLGHTAEGAGVLERLIKGGVRSLELLLALTSFPASVVSIDVLAELDKVIKDQGQAKPDFVNFAAFVRAAALDKAGRHAEAWEQVVPANRTILRSVREDLQEVVARQHASLAWLRQTSLKPKEEPGRTISLFILGPSRSGKTTMEKLVAILDGVKPGYENPIVENAVRRTFQTSALLTNSFFENLPSQLYALCREIYLEELARRADSAKVFTNTHPVRIHDAGRMAVALPNVRFLFVKRNPEDNMLRMYMRRYARGNIHSYDLNSTRDHIVWYHQMMDLLAQKLPDTVRVIHYEDMVADPAAALRTAAELCGLPMPTAPLPPVGDDRGCAEPYREFMAAELGS